MKFYYFPTHHLIGEEITLIGVEVLITPTLSFHMLQKKAYCSCCFRDSTRDIGPTVKPVFERHTATAFFNPPLLLLWRSIRGGVQLD